MTTTTTTQYRRLHVGEELEPGDQWFDPERGRWAETHMIGRIVGIPGRTTFAYRRPVHHQQPETAGVAA